MSFCRLLDHFVSNVGKLEDIYATIKQVGARHGEGGYGVTPEHMKVYLDLIYSLIIPKVEVQSSGNQSFEFVTGACCSGCCSRLQMPNRIYPFCF